MNAFIIELFAMVDSFLTDRGSTITKVNFDALGYPIVTQLSVRNGIRSKSEDMTK